MRVITFVLTATLSSSAFAGYKLIDTDSQKLEVGGRIVLQHFDSTTEFSDGSEESDNQSYIRRLRPYVKYTYGDWGAKLAWEFGKGPDSVKDAYIRYRGISWLDIKLGNETVAFSRERMTSSAKQHFAERSLVGENNWGTPGRQLGLHFSTRSDGPVSGYFSIAKADVYADEGTEIRFISPLSHTDIDDDLTDSGLLYSARVDYHLWKAADYSQGTFKSSPALTLSGATYYWDNDEDSPGYYENISGYELAVAFRGYGASVDAEYHRIDADAIILPESGNSLTIGIIADSQVELDIYNLEFGYMVLPKQLELAAGIQSISAGSEGKESSIANQLTWQNSWDIWQVGASYFIDKHDNKIQISYRDEDNVQGKDRSRSTWYLQYQYDY